MDADIDSDFEKKTSKKPNTMTIPDVLCLIATKTKAKIEPEAEKYVASVALKTKEIVKRKQPKKMLSKW